MDNPPETMTEIYRTARKIHKCCECMSDINPGEKYLYMSGILDGEPSSYKTCLRCEKVRADAYRIVREVDEGPALGGLAEWILEYAAESLNAPIEGWPRLGIIEKGAGLLADGAKT